MRRGARLRLAILTWLVRKLGPPLGGVALVVVAGAALVRWDGARHGARLGDFSASAYAVATQLFFQPTEPYPGTALSRVVFWMVPVLGVLLVAEGLVKVGDSIFDPVARRDAWARIVTERTHAHVVVCGVGHVGIRVVQQLRALGEDVVCVEIDASRPFVEDVRALGVPVHVGDARRDEVLRAAGVERARAIVCAMNDDLANLEIALDAKRYNPAIRVVMRMFDQRLAGKVGGALDLDESFSTSAASAPLVAMQALHAGVRSAYRLGDELRVTVELAVEKPGKKATVASLEERLPCRIVARRFGDAFVQARASDAVARGDTIVVDVAAADIERVRGELG